MGPQLDIAHRYKIRLSVLLPKHHPLAARDRLTPRDMSGEKYIALSSGLIARQSIDRELQRIDETLDIHYEVSSPAVLHPMVARGCGFGFSDLVVLEPELRDKTVLVPWEPETYMEIGIYLTRESAKNENPGLSRMPRRGLDGHKAIVLKPIRPLRFLAV